MLSKDKFKKEIQETKKGYDLREVYIYKLTEWDNIYEYAVHLDGYITSNILYDNVEFNQLCYKCIEEFKSIHKQVTLDNITQYLILNYGFKKLEPIQSFEFDV